MFVLNIFVVPAHSAVWYPLQQFDGRPVREEVEWIPKQHRLRVCDEIDSGAPANHLRLLPDQTGVAHCETVQQVHEHDDDEEDEEEENQIGDDVVGEGYVGKLQLPDEHGGGLEERQPDPVEEGVLFVGLGAGVVGVHHDVKGDAEGNNDDAVPEEEAEEGGDHGAQHGDVGAEARVATNHQQTLSPGEEDAEGGQVAVSAKVAGTGIAWMWSENN